MIDNAIIRLEFSTIIANWRPRQGGEAKINPMKFKYNPSISRIDRPTLNSGHYRGWTILLVRICSAA